MPTLYHTSVSCVAVKLTEQPGLTAGWYVKMTVITNGHEENYYVGPMEESEVYANAEKIEYQENVIMRSVLTNAALEIRERLNAIRSE